MSLDAIGFKSAASRVESEKKLRAEIREHRLSFGVKFLDVLTGGIRKNDCMILGAAPGSGKTELATTIAVSNALQGKRVHVFALEAEEAEWERRMKFQLVAHFYYADGGKEELDFLGWIDNEFDFLSKYEEIADKMLAELKNLFVYYRGGSFDVSDFKRLFAALNGQSDLVLVDHLHYFDLHSENENKEITEIMKVIKDMSQIQGIPVVAIAHLRKQGPDGSLCPDLSDFHGTSNLGKIATKALTLASGGMLENGNFITYMRMCKFRLAGNRASVVGVTQFNPRTNRYSERYKVGKLVSNGQKWEELETIPSWISRAK